VEVPQNVNILLVDDLPENLFVLEAMLADLAQNLVKAHSGEQALRAILKEDFAVILLDAKMPGMDGFETAALIREREKSRYTPIILLTAFDKSDEETLRGYSAGAVDFIFKPIIPGILRAKVSTFVELYQKSQEVSAQAVQIGIFNQELEATNEELQEARAELELRVQERTADLQAANEELVRLTDTLHEQTLDLQAQNEDLNAFSYSVAHDLKNPIFNIIGYSDLLKDETLPTDQRTTFVDVIARSADKASNIVDELLLLAMIRNVEVELSPLDMSLVLAEAQKRLAYMIDEYKPEIILPASWPPILGHAAWLEEVWVNYLSNAMKYGGRPPRIEVGATPLPNGQIRFWVCDNGSGILPDQQAQLFKVFTRLNQVNVEGHGLGLSIVRRIVNKLGGEVGVESQFGQGSTFSFTLPAPAAIGHDPLARIVEEGAGS